MANYGDDLGRRFSDQYGDWRSNNRSPPTRDEYLAHLNDSQTHQCTRLAAIYYNERNGVRLSNVQPEDSHGFSCSWTAPGDNRRCFHATFKADVRHGATRFFFAEILGKCDGGPEEVQHCVKLGGPSTWSTNICTCCSGMWHPKARGTFDFGRD